MGKCIDWKPATLLGYRVDPWEPGFGTTAVGSCGPVGVFETPSKNGCFYKCKHELYLSMH